MPTRPAPALRLALFGLNYGLAYLDAIAAVPNVELVAVGARGSRRSRAVARELGLPLHTSVAALLAAERPDAAIVAVPSDATADIVGSLLTAGCHTLCEFPIEGDEADAAVRLAAESGAWFDVNAHFSHLRAPTAFIRRCAQEGPPALVDIVCHERTLFPCLDTTRRAFGHAFTPSGAMSGVVVGTVGEAPAVLRVTPLLSRVDDGSDVFFGQRISAGFAATEARPQGRSITLVDSFGPVITSRANLVDLARVAGATPAAAIADERTRANRAVLTRFVRACRTPAARRTPSATVEIARGYTATVDLLA